ncbi:endonuclease [Flavipsychrobacter stenotrophus]|uniref:Endonuclease n=1 Tax=Flavipsychrobacter stenotrophus TaxID=2077091 RepID=A0A2S7SX69_9BACT|nr:endonuclease/exonuclease/phosphatase family protein [Flavipsychrobacter stenotrophus]PQJ11308.1 endonuclease [Flavipsychrobacter stenotrophus]
MIISRIIKYPALSILFVAFLIASCKNTENKIERSEPQKNVNKITVAFYNCENLFDTHHQPGKQDEDFTPEGKYHYTQRIFEQKLHNLATVFQSMNSEHNNLAIAGLAEVENDRVLQDLCSQPELGDKHFRHICHAGPDPRGINVGFIYDPSLFILLNEEIVPVIFTGTGHRSHGRDILHIQGVLDGDTVHVFVNHWTSRRKGEDESERKRVQAAQANKTAIDELMNVNPNTKVIVMGDFNDNPTDRSIGVVLAATGNKNVSNSIALYNPFEQIFNSGEGTEKYRSTWNLFDQIIVSGAFLSDKAQHLHFNKAEIYRPAFITDHKKHDETPKRSFAGSRWMNGYSDHFPVLIELAK